MSARHSSQADSFQVAEKATVGSKTPNHNSLERTFSPKNGESTLPDSEDKMEKAVLVVDNLEDDWENDPENSRNWSTRKKWTAVCIVRVIFFSG